MKNNIEYLWFICKLGPCKGYIWCWHNHCQYAPCPTSSCLILQLRKAFMLQTRHWQIWPKTRNFMLDFRWSSNAQIYSILFSAHDQWGSEILCGLKECGMSKISKWNIREEWYGLRKFRLEYFVHKMQYVDLECYIIRGIWRKLNGSIVVSLKIYNLLTDSAKWFTYLLVSYLLCKFYNSKFKKCL